MGGLCEIDAVLGCYKHMHKYVYKLLQRRAAWGPSPEEEIDETLEEVWVVNAPLP